MMMLYSLTPPAEAVGMLNDDGFYWIEWPIASGNGTIGLQMRQFGSYSKVDE